MKTKSKINIWLFIATFMLLIAPVLQSCDSDDTVSGVAKVERVRPVNAELADQSLESVSLGEVVVLVGNNLKSVIEIYINDFRTAFNPTMVTNTHLIFKVNVNTPFYGSSPNVPNEIKLVSNDGVFTMPFVVLPPAPVVETISNEFAKAGETLYITGQYFYFIEGVEFPGGITSTQVSTNATGTVMQVVVPEGVEEAGTISVTTQSGTGVLSPKYRFNDLSGIFCDFDEKNPFTPWGAKPLLGESNPDGISGKYVFITETNMASPMWWNNDQVIPLDGGVQWPTLTGNAADYAIKMEIRTPQAWKSGWFEMNLGWTYFYRVKPWDVNPDPAEYWNVTGTNIPTPTDRWFTVVIPLNQFRLKDAAPDGAPISTLSQLSGKGVVMAFQNQPIDQGGMIIDNLHICVDNLRLVKITAQ